jgi:carboxymethylenebutenolidase
MKNFFGLWIAGLLLFGACSSEQDKDYVSRMFDEHKEDVPTQNASAELTQSAQVSGEEVNYATVNGTDITGYMARPEDAVEVESGIIVIHEWWGLNDNIRMMTDKLAGEGYAALAVDLYNGNVAETPDRARLYMGSVDKEEALENLGQAYTYLTDAQDVSSVGTIGWCFGGGWSLQAALSQPEEIDATVIYYGQLVTDASELEELQMPILGIFGAEDEGIPPEKVKQFEKALNEAGVQNEIHIYEEADHAFANPSGTRYNPEAAEDAWQKTVEFLEENLSKEE